MIKSELRDCQHDMFNFIKDKPYWGVFAEYGIGKSLVALSYIEYNDLNDKRVLIVGSTINTANGGAWETEINKHTNFHYFSLTSRSKADRIDLLKTSGVYGLFLINYDAIPSLLDYLIAAQFDCIIFDESTSIKNQKTIRWKKCKKLVKNIPQRGILTGSPITENYLNLWPQIYILDEGKSLGTFWGYLTKYFYKFMYDWHPKKKVQQQIISCISDFCISRFLKDCVKLPPKKNIYIPLQPTREQNDLFKMLNDEFELNYGDVILSMQNILPIYQKLRQICSGFFYNTNKIPSILKHNTPKDAMLLEIIEEMNLNNGILIWCEYIFEIHKIRELLLGHKYRVLVVHDKKSKEDWKKKWDSGKYDIILSTPSILGSGETLLVKYAIRYSHDWSYEKRQNSRARNYRRGSEKFKNIFYVNLYIEGSIEESILKNLSKKMNLVRDFKEYLLEFERNNAKR